MARTIKFNMNDIVRVKLTDHGRRLHREYHDNLFANYLSARPIKYKPIKEDNNGWSEWQLWNLMSIFGKHIYMGCKSVFETNIELVVDD